MTKISGEQAQPWVGGGRCAASTSGNCLHLLQGFGACGDECDLAPDEAAQFASDAQVDR